VGEVLRTPDMSVGTVRNLSAVYGSGTSTGSDLSTHIVCPFGCVSASKIGEMSHGKASHSTC